MRHSCSGHWFRCPLIESFADQNWLGIAWASAGAIADIAGIGSASADSVIDFGRAIAWGGIAELRDATGASIADYSVLSASSGFDYRNA